MRLGLVLSVKDEQVFLQALPKSESTLPYALQSLFLEQGVSVPKTTSFASNTYKEFPVRYANIDVARNLSIDFTVAKNHWYIGTSKATLRALLDISTK
jgi:hypothetical protein